MVARVDVGPAECTDVLFHSQYLVSCVVPPGTGFNNSVHVTVDGQRSVAVPAGAAVGGGSRDAAGQRAGRRRRAARTAPVSRVALLPRDPSTVGNTT